MSHKIVGSPYIERLPPWILGGRCGELVSFNYVAHGSQCMISSQSQKPPDDLEHHGWSVSVPRYPKSAWLPRVFTHSHLYSWDPWAVIVWWWWLSVCPCFSCTRLPLKQDLFSAALTSITLWAGREITSMGDLWWFLSVAIIWLIAKMNFIDLRERETFCEAV